MSYIANKDKLKAKGVDRVVFIASNDHWVMSAWGKANGVKDDFIVSFTLPSPPSLFPPLVSCETSSYTSPPLSLSRVDFGLYFHN